MGGAKAAHNGAARGGAGADISAIQVPDKSTRDQSHKECHGEREGDTVDAGLKSMDHCECPSEV